MRCEICGKEAPYFTETYDPEEKKVRTIYLCEEHQKKLYKRIVDAMLYMGSEYIVEYNKRILKLPETLDVDEEAIRKMLEANDKAIPIIQEPPMKDTIRDIGKVLEWLYINGIWMHGENEKIEEAIRRIEGEE